MSSFLRQLKRQAQKSNGTLTHKKVIAKKLGCSLSELDERLARRERNLKEMGDNKNDSKSSRDGN